MAMITQTALRENITYRTPPKLQIYTADDLLRFADETDKIKKTGGLISWQNVRDRVYRKYDLSD